MVSFVLVGLKHPVKILRSQILFTPKRPSLFNIISIDINIYQLSEDVLKIRHSHSILYPTSPEKIGVGNIFSFFDVFNDSHA